MVSKKSKKVKVEVVGPVEQTYPEVIIDEAANVTDGMMEEAATQEIMRTVSTNDPNRIQGLSIESQIQALAEKNSIPVEELIEEYQKQYQELSMKGVSANLEKLAYNGVLNLVRKKTKPKVDYVPKAKAEQALVFVIGDSGCFDKIEMLAGIARRYGTKNGLAAAVQAKLINKDSEPIDTRDTVFGKPNDQYGKPLGHRDKDGNFILNHERSRTLDLIGKLPNEEEWKLGTIQTNDNQLALGWGKVRFGALASIFGIIKENNPKPLTEEEKTNMSEEEQASYYKNAEKSFKLNSSNAEDTRSIFHAVHEDIDFDEIFMRVVGPKLTEIGEVPREYELLPKTPKGKPLWDHRFYVRGTVSWIARDRRSPIGTINMGLWEPTTGAEIVVQIPEHLSADFGENSEIIVDCKLNKGDLRVDGEGGKAEYLKGEGAVRLDALGFYKIKDMCTPAETSSPEALADEAIIDGWIES
jgi:hypothetical protein